MTKSPMPAAEPMSQEIVERLRELLAKAAAVVELVEGFPGYATCTNFTGERLKDQSRWVDFYLAVKDDTLLSTLTNLTPSVEREQSLQAIADNVEYWLKWVTRTHENEGIEVTPDTHVMLPGPDAPPYWPSVGQLGRWLLVLRAPALALPSEPPSRLLDDRCELCHTSAPAAFAAQCNRPECPHRAPSQGDVEGRAREACTTCGKALAHGYFACDETMGHYCEECWPAVRCEELHGEGCATTVFIGNDEAPSCHHSDIDSSGYCHACHTKPFGDPRSALNQGADDGR